MHHKSSKFISNKFIICALLLIYINGIFLSKCLAHLTVCDVCFVSQGVLLCPQTLSQARRTRLRRAFTEATGDTVSYVKTVDIYKQYSSKQSNIKQYKKSTKSNSTPSPQQPPASHLQTVLFERSTPKSAARETTHPTTPFHKRLKKTVYESLLCVVLDLCQKHCLLVCAPFRCCLLFLLFIFLFVSQYLL